MLKPHHVVEHVRRRRTRAEDPIRFYWVAVTVEDGGGDRDEFARSLHAAASGHPLLPVVLRVAGFTDSNSVMNDLAGVLERSKDDLLPADMRERIGRHGFLDVVLISRRELALAVTSSPLVLPHWFPVCATQEVTARIDDLTWTASVPLSAPEAHIGDLRRLLCELDRALLARLRAVGEQDHRLARGLLDRIKTRNDSTLSMDDFVVAARASLDAVRNPRDYRPSSRGPTMVSRLWRATAETPKDGLQKMAKSLAIALSVARGAVDTHDESIIAVLGRPTNPIEDATVRWAFDVILTTGAACQLATAAAHADAYSHYPVRLVGSLSRDLQRALDGFIRMLEA